jgi:hypothetical protein
MANKYLSKLFYLLKSNLWVIAAFLVPLSIRSIPETLSWPYLLGYDTLTVVHLIRSGQVLLSGPLVFIHNHLFYTFATLTSWAIGDPIVVLKIFGPVLMGLVSMLMWLYAKRGLGWSNIKSFLVALLVGAYFVSLRNSWDLYAQSFALVFLLATLVVLKSLKSNWRFPVALAFMILTVMSHELISVILFFILGLEGLRFLLKKQPDFKYLLTCLTVAFGLFLFKRYSLTSGSIVLPVVTIASEPSVGFSLHILGFLLYCYGLLLPFVTLGMLRLKDWVLRFWFILCLSIPLLTMAFPTTYLYYWNRWAYLLVYPLIFFTVEGIAALWKFQSTHKNQISRVLPKAFTIFYLVLLLTLSGFYLAVSPQNQISFFSTSNPYLAYIPSSMVQNTLPIQDNSALVKCVEWINENAAADSVIVAHYALYDLITIYDHDQLVISVRQSGSMWNYLQNETSLVDGIVNASRQALVDEHSAVYTIWWINGDDAWYKISSLPPEFTPVYEFDKLAVYSYTPLI